MRYYSLWYYSSHYFTFVQLKKDKHLIELGNQIRELRKSKGLSQEQLALQAEVDRSYVGGIERGERNVSFLTLVKIAECLDCDIAKFTKHIPK
jgi:transcriptional regulator with XRE-family HTH domain